MCDAFYLHADGHVTACEYIDSGHNEHRGYVWRAVNERLARGEFFQWRDIDPRHTVETKKLQYTESEAVVLRHALGGFIKNGYDSEVDRIRGAVAQQLIRKMQGV